MPSVRCTIARQLWSGRPADRPDLLAVKRQRVADEVLAERPAVRHVLLVVLVNLAFDFVFSFGLNFVNTLFASFVIVIFFNEPRHSR